MRSEARGMFVALSGREATTAAVGARSTGQEADPLRHTRWLHLLLLGAWGAAPGLTRSTRDRPGSDRPVSEPAVHFRAAHPLPRNNVADRLAVFPLVRLVRCPQPRLRMISAADRRANSFFPWLCVWCSFGRCPSSILRVQPSVRQSGRPPIPQRCLLRLPQQNLGHSRGLDE